MPTVEVYHIGDMSKKYANAGFRFSDDGRWVEVFDFKTDMAKGHHSAATITYIDEY